MTERITLKVGVNLDAVPGAFHTPESAEEFIQQILDNAIGHYKPRVYLENNS